LPDFSLKIRSRETLALVGHTGAGKSSIARLIGRFYEFQEGQILVDGRDIRRLNLQQYRQHIGVVPQEPFLFSGTVRDNIRYGRPDASDEEAREAAMRISKGEWLGGLSAGLDTDVGERGANLSMGQRQLVALARVLLKDRPSLSWTRRRPASTRSPRPRSRKGWRRSCVIGRRSSLLTGCPRSATPTGSSS